MNQSYLGDQLSLFRNKRTLKNKTYWFARNYEKFLPHNNNASILEVGPGFGELMDYLVLEKKYSRYQAIDNSKDVVDYCNSKHDKKAIHIESLNQFFGDNGSEKYDAILMFHVLEHIQKENVIEILSILRNALAEGGVLIIEVPNIANPIVGLYLYYSDFTHETPFTSISLAYALKKAEFKDALIVDCKVPVNNVFRLGQRVLQFTLEFVIKILFKFYLPSIKISLSHSIGVVAKR